MNCEAMRKLALSTFILIISNFVNAQCPFDPIINPSALALCPNESDTLFTQVANSYQWYKNGNPISGANANFLVVHQTSDAGASFVVVSTNSGCSEPSPAVSVTNQIIPPIEISILGELSPSACAGETRFLAVNDPFNINIRWFRDGVQLTSQTNDTIAAVQSGNYSVIAFSDFCPTNSQTSAIQAISYVNATTPVISFVSSNLSLSTSAPGATLQWFVNGIPVEGATSATFLPGENGTVEVVATFSLGCVRTSSPYDYTSFEPDCEHNPLVNPNNLVLCPNSNDTLFTQMGDAYRWFKDGNEISGATDSFIVVNSSLDGGSMFSVETTTNGCAERSPEVLVDGWVFLPITVSTEGIGTDFVCQGDTLTLQVNQPYTENIRWFLNGELIPNEDSNSITIWSSGVYNVTAATDICPNYEETSLDLMYSFLPNPQPVLSYFSVSNTIAVDVVAINYTWSVDSQLFPGASGQIITPSIAGAYSVNVNYANGCSNSSEAYVYDPVGIEELAKVNFRAFPNPTTDVLFINSKEHGLLNIYSISGVLMYTAQINSKSSTIDLSRFNNGVYLLQFIGESGNYESLILKK
jgi:hypothetical protein